MDRADDSEVDLRDVEIVDADGKPIVLTRSDGTAAATKSPKERMLEGVRQQVWFEEFYLRGSGLSIEMLRCVDRFLTLSPEVRARIIKVS